LSKSFKGEHSEKA